MSSKTIQLHMNRVEGDLEVRAEVNDGVVVNAWCTGTMYRGFERIMVGRGPLDGLVITPRICGICSTGHQTAASRALDAISGAIVPPDGQRIRNLALMAEHVQSDVRHTTLMFAADLTNPAHAGCALYDEILRRYEPFKGTTIIDVIKHTKKILELVAIVGGQWPHSSFMIPGGVASVPSQGDLSSCLHLVRMYRAWYEQRILGCSIDRWADVVSQDSLERWLEEKDAHRNGELGFLIRCMRALGLDKQGRGHANFLCFGSLELPEGTSVTSTIGARFLNPGGFARGVDVTPFDQSSIEEHVAHSWFADYAGGRHPYDGETRPYATGDEGGKYSWAKAPRYNGMPAETGPLAEMIMAGDRLFRDLVSRSGPSVFIRQLARLVRPAMMLPVMEQWLNETTGDGKFYHSPGPIKEGRGFGLCHASRGVLGHWVEIRDGMIEHYQIITPTAWNASPRDSKNVRGPIEEALIGTPVLDADNPVDVFHVVRSFDPCLVCTVHTLDGRGAKVSRC